MRPARTRQPGIQPPTYSSLTRETTSLACSRTLFTGTATNTHYSRARNWAWCGQVRELELARDLLERSALEGGLSLVSCFQDSMPTSQLRPTWLGISYRDFLTHLA